MLEGLATHAARTGELDSARDLLEESLSLRRRSAAGGRFDKLATVEFCDGALDRAHELLHEARDLAERDDLRLTLIDLTSAYIELVRGNADEADVYLTSARN